MQKTYINGTAGGVTLMGLAGSVLGLFGRASDVNDFFTFVNSGVVNGQGVLTLMFFVGGSTLVAVNAGWFWTKYKWWKQERQQRWNISAYEALSHIVHFSLLGIGFPTSGKQRAAIEAFVDAAENGSLRVMGRPPSSSKLVRIPRREWATGTLDEASCQSIKSDLGVVMICRNPERTVRYVGLVVDSDQVKRVWPNKRGSHSF